MKKTASRDASPLPRLPWLLVDGYLENERRHALEVSTYSEVVGALQARHEYHAKALSIVKGNAELTAAVRRTTPPEMPPENRLLTLKQYERARSLDADAIRECNRILPGWPLHDPIIREAIENRTREMVCGTESEIDAAAEWLQKALLTRTPERAMKKRRTMPYPWAYVQCWMRVYPEVLYVCEILKQERDADKSELWAALAVAVETITKRLSERYGGKCFAFTHETTILAILKDRRETPSAITYRIIGMATGRNPDRIKKSLSEKRFPFVRQLMNHDTDTEIRGRAENFRAYLYQ